MWSLFISVNHIYKDQTIDAVPLLTVCAVAINGAVSPLWIARYVHAAVVPPGIRSS